jgi:hypothetical protein
MSSPPNCEEFKSSSLALDLELDAAMEARTRFSPTFRLGLGRSYMVRS